MVNTEWTATFLRPTLWHDLLLDHSTEAVRQESPLAEPARPTGHRDEKEQTADVTSI